MPRAIRVLWTITPLRCPRPWRSCRRCGARRPFRCSEKFRLNANGKRLDAWLVYKCTSCDESWNHAVIERRALRDIEPTLLAALEANDATLVRRFAFDIVALRKAAYGVEESVEVQVHKQSLGEAPAASPSVEILLSVPFAVSLRLDKLLANELHLSRSRIVVLADAGLIDTADALNKSVRDGSKLIVDLAHETGAEQIARAALEAT